MSFRTAIQGANRGVVSSNGQEFARRSFLLQFQITATDYNAFLHHD